MYTAESRGGRGLGIFIFRHEGFDSQTPYEVSSRAGFLAKNIVGIEPTGDGGEGRYVDNPDTYGDWPGAICWPKDSREIPAHFFVAPAIVAGKGTKPVIPTKVTSTTAAAGGSVQSGGSVSAIGAGGGGQGQRKTGGFQAAIPTSQNKSVALPSAEVGSMLPVIGTEMSADSRFAPIGYATPMDPFGNGPCWPKFAKGMYGIALPATNEPRQVNLLYPCDPRLIAVNFGDEPEMGTFVCDVDEDGNIAMDRAARLQSAFRVIKRRGGNGNVLALQLTFAENDDCEGGMVIDHHAGDVCARLSFLNGGPIDVGDVNDPHQQSFTDDGEPINAGHLSLQSLFKSKFNRDMDGPLYHEGYYKGAQKAPFRTFTHFEWDASGVGGGGKIGAPQVGGFHRWTSEAWMYVPNEQTPPPTQNPPPTPTPTPTPTPDPVPTGGGGTPPTKDGGGTGGPSDGGDSGGAPNGHDGKSGESAEDRWHRAYGEDVPYPGDGWAGAWRLPIPGKDGGAPGQNNGGTGQPPHGDDGGHVPVGPLPPGSDFPGWKNPDGSDPFWPFGFGPDPNGNGSEEKQKKREQKKRDRDARRKARKDKHKKGKKVGLIGVDKEPPDQPVDPPKVNGWGWLHWWGKPPKNGIGQFFRPQTPPPPNVFSPNIRPNDGSGGESPTPSSGAPTPGWVPTGAPGVGRGPMPAGAIPGPQLPPAMVNEVMLPSIIARPQSYSYTAPDMRYDPAPQQQDVLIHDRLTPIVGHMQAYGAQGGAVGSNPGLSAPNRWLYTTKPQTSGSRWWQGTGNGGWWITTPETDFADSVSDLNPTGITQSTTYFGVAPRVYFGAGLPDLSQGGMRKGYRWGADRSGNLIFDRMSASGVPSNVVELGSDGIVTIFQRGSGAGQGAEVVLQSPNGTNYVALQAPDSAASNVVIVLPDTDPVAGQSLTVESFSGGVATLSWADGGGSTIDAIFAAIANTTVGGTGTETSLIASGAGNFVGAASVDSWQPGKSVRIMLRGPITSLGITPGTVRMQAKIGGTTIIDTGAVNIVAGLNAATWEAEVILTCRDDSTPSATTFGGSVIFKTTGATPIASYELASTTIAATADTSAPTAIDVTWQWGTSSGGNTLTATVGKIDTETPG
jgi:hypothetical protein